MSKRYRPLKNFTRRLPTATAVLSEAQDWCETHEALAHGDYCERVDDGTVRPGDCRVLVAARKLPG